MKIEKYNKMKWSSSIRGINLKKMLKNTMPVYLIFYAPRLEMSYRSWTDKWSVDNRIQKSVQIIIIPFVNLGYYIYISDCCFKNPYHSTNGSFKVIILCKLYYKTLNEILYSNKRANFKFFKIFKFDWKILTENRKINSRRIQNFK